MVCVGCQRTYGCSRRQSIDIVFVVGDPKVVSLGSRVHDSHLRAGAIEDVLDIAVTRNAPLGPVAAAARAMRESDRREQRE